MCHTILDVSHNIGGHLAKVAKKIMFVVNRYISLFVGHIIAVK